jgi:hypothetical protein
MLASVEMDIIMLAEPKLALNSLPTLSPGLANK